MVFVISLSLHGNYNNYNFWQFYLDIESKILYPLTSSTHLPTSSTSSDSVVTPTPSVTGGK